MENTNDYLFRAHVDIGLEDKKIKPVKILRRVKS